MGEEESNLRKRIRTLEEDPLMTKTRIKTVW